MWNTAFGLVLLVKTNYKFRIYSVYQCLWVNYQADKKRSVIKCTCCCLTASCAFVCVLVCLFVCTCVCLCARKFVLAYVLLPVWVNSFLYDFFMPTAILAEAYIVFYHNPLINFDIKNDLNLFFRELCFCGTGSPELWVTSAYTKNPANFSF